MTDAQRKADISLDILDGLADKWAEEINLTTMIKNVVSPMSLNKNVPTDARASFALRMEAQISAIVRQAFVEGSYRALCGLQDEKAALARLKEAAKPACAVCGGTGYNVTHVESAAWREAIAFDQYVPCECARPADED